ALDLLVTLMAHEDDRVVLLRELARLDVDLGDERAGGVDRPELALARVLVNGRGDAVGREDHDLALRDLGLLLDEDRAPFGQLLDDVLVVDDLLPDVDRCAVEVERLLDRLPGALDARAVTARRGEKHATRRAGRGLGGHRHGHKGYRRVFGSMCGEPRGQRAGREAPQRIPGSAASAGAPTAPRLRAQTCER